MNLGSTIQSAVDSVTKSIAKSHSKELAGLKKACEQFEAVFAKQLLGEMRKGVQEIKIGDQSGSEIYKDMMDQTIAGSVAHQGALGIGQMLYKQFEKQVAGRVIVAGDAKGPLAATTPIQGLIGSENAGGTPVLRTKENDK